MGSGKEFRHGSYLWPLSIPFTRYMQESCSNLLIMSAPSFCCAWHSSRSTRFSTQLTLIGRQGAHTTTTVNWAISSLVSTGCLLKRPPMHGRAFAGPRSHNVGSSACRVTSIFNVHTYY